MNIYIYIFKNYRKWRNGACGGKAGGKTVKAHLTKRLVCLILAIVLCLSAAVIPALAANDTKNVKVKVQKVSNDTVPTELNPERQAAAEDTVQTQSAEGPVRVSIVVKGGSVLDKYSTNGLTANYAAANYRQQVRASQNAVAREISADVLGGKKLDVVWNLTLAANIISANVESDQIDAIRALPDVEAVVVEQRYYPDRSAEKLATQPNMATSSSMIGTNVAYETGYTGAGTRIAVIDTGIDTDHQSFDNGAFDYALQQEANGNENYIDQSKVTAVLSQLNIAQNGVSADDLYYGSKLPFAYNYVDKNTDVTHDNDTQSEHGSHVAGIAAANKYVPQTDGDETTYVSALDTVKTQGVAPEAQLLVMKVFGSNGGAFDSDYMAAIEDAIVLGADSINLSLGSSYPGPSKYTAYMDADTDPVPVYQAILDSLASKDAVVSISAGNSGNWAENAYAGSNGYDASSGTGLLYDDDVSMDVVGAPGSFTNAFTVTSVDNIGNTGEYLEVDGQKFIYMETTGEKAGHGMKQMKSIAGEYEYILIDGVGNTGDYDAIGGKDLLEGKIVFCSRGELDFSMKASNAAQYGVAATIVYNNVPGTISMDLSSYWNEAPCVLVTQDTARVFRDKAEPVYDKNDSSKVLYYKGRMKVSADAAVIPDSAEYMTMSSFASWGVPGSLELKPEITAPGGNIYSVNGLEQGGKGYENMSGTSMAAPQIAGMSALFAQHYQAAGLSKTNRSVRHLAQSLLMSTATPAREDATHYWSVLKQGAGVANIGAAITADSYVWMADSANKGASDGKVKVELGEDAAKNGTYSFSFDLYDLSGTEQTYDLSASFFTQAMTTIGGDRYLDEATAPLVANVTYGSAASGSSVTVPANGHATVTVNIALTAEQKAALDRDYSVGAYLEGYVFAQERTSAEGVSGTCHSIPVLGFYGSWTASSMFEVGDYYHYQSGEETRMPYLGNAYTDNNVLYVKYASDNSPYSRGSVLGGNPVVNDSKYLPERNAINSENGDSIYYWKFCAIRNVADSRLQIINKTTNTVLAEQTLGHFLGAFYSQYFNPSEYVNLPLDWKPAGMKEGEQLELNLTLAPEYYVQDDGSVNWASLGSGATQTFTAVIDNTAPVVNNVTVADNEMTVNIFDNQYVAAVRLYDRSGTVKLAEAGANQTTAANTANDFTLNLSSANGNIFYVKAYDYAMNESTYRVEMEIGEQPGEPAMFLFDAYYTGNKIWNTMSGSDTTYVKTPYAASADDFYAAAYVDGKIVASTSTGDLYVLDANDPENASYVRTLDTLLLDMAYDKTSDTLYGVDAGSKVYTIDRYSGELTLVGTLPVKARTLACDDSGNFYYAFAETDYSYYKIYRLPITAVTSDAAADPEAIVTVGQRYTTPEEDDFSAVGSLEWESKENVLFFAVSSALHKIDLTAKTSAECTESGWGDYFPAEFHALCIPREGGSWSASESAAAVALSDHSVSLLLGKTQTLKASVLPWNLANREVVWSSSNSSVAAVSANGVVTAKNAGTCTIRAASAQNRSVYDECTVSVEQLNVTLTGMLQDANGKAELFSWDLKNSSSWKTGIEIDTSMAAMAYDPVDQVYYVIDATDRTMVKDESQTWKLHKVDPAAGKSLAVADNGIGVPMIDMAYSTKFSAAGAARLVGIYRMGYVFKPFDPMDTSNVTLRDAIQLPVSNHHAQNLIGIASLGVETHSSDAWYDGATDWYGDPENTTWSGEYEAEHFAILDDAGYLWDLWISVHDDGYGFDYTTTKTPLSALEAPPYDSTSNYVYCSMTAYSDGSLYLSRFNGDTNEIYRLRKDADGSYEAVLIDDFGSGVWPALLGGVETSKDDPVPVTVDKSALQKLYDDNQNRRKDDYVSGWDAFETAMREAEAVLADENATQEAVDAAKVKLEAAIAGLKKKPETPIIPPYYPILGNTGSSRANSKLPFTDVSKSDWFYDAVKGAWQNYLIDGVTATTYKPHGTLTVAEAIKLASALHQMQNTGKVTLMNGKTNWYNSYVEYGIANGILDKSYANYTRAQMNAPATRREFVSIFYPAMDGYKALNNIADNAIPDVKLGDKCADEIYAFYRAGILTGSDKQGTFNPDSTIVRSEVAAILLRMYDASTRVQFTLK